MSGLLNSCSEPPKAVVKDVLDLKKEINSNEVVIVADVGKRYGEKFKNTFVNKLAELTRDSGKKVSIISYGEFVRSPYNNPKEKSSFPDSLFVFMKTLATESDEWGPYNEKYLMEAKHLDQEPFFVQEVSLCVGRRFINPIEQRADELAHTVFKELHARNIL